MEMLMHLTECYGELTLRQYFCMVSFVFQYYFYKIKFKIFLEV